MAFFFCRAKPEDFITDGKKIDRAAIAIIAMDFYDTIIGLFLAYR